MIIGVFGFLFNVIVAGLFFIFEAGWVFWVQVVNMLANLLLSVVMMVALAGDDDRVGDIAGKAWLGTLVVTVFLIAWMIGTLCSHSETCRSVVPTVLG